MRSGKSWVHRRLRKCCVVFAYISTWICPLILTMQFSRKRVHNATGPARKLFDSDRLTDIRERQSNILSEQQGEIKENLHFNSTFVTDPGDDTVIPLFAPDPSYICFHDPEDLNYFDSTSQELKGEADTGIRFCILCSNN